MIRKMFFGLAWLGILVLAVGGIYLSIFPSQILSIDFNLIIFRGGLLGISLFYLLMFIEKLVVLFERKKDYQVRTENGRLTVTSTSIDNLVKEVASSNPDLKNIKTTNKLKRKKLYITVKVDAYSDSDIAKNTIEIQKKIKNDIFEYLSLEVEEIEVKVAKLLKRKGSSFLSDRGEN